MKMSSGIAGVLLASAGLARVGLGQTFNEPFFYVDQQDHPAGATPSSKMTSLVWVCALGCWDYDARTRAQVTAQWIVDRRQA
jgi:hypothetical protein